MGQGWRETQRMESRYLSRVDAPASPFAEIGKVDGFRIYDLRLRTRALKSNSILRSTGLTSKRKIAQNLSDFSLRSSVFFLSFFFFLFFFFFSFFYFLLSSFISPRRYVSIGIRICHCIHRAIIISSWKCSLMNRYEASMMRNTYFTYFIRIQDPWRKE
jgi:sensor histidine kinase YesM